MEIFSTNPALRLSAGGLVFLFFSILFYAGKLKMSRYKITVPRIFFMSEENWSKLNRYAGKVFGVWSIMIAITGVILFPFSNSLNVDYGYISSTIAIPILIVYSYSKKF